MENRIWMVGAWLMLAAACQVEGIEAAEAPDASEFRELPPHVIEDVCPGWRQVAIVDPEDGCPVVDTHWVGSPMFPGTVGDEYEKYCVYEYRPDSADAMPTTVQIDHFQDYAGFVEVGTECLAIRSQGTLASTLNPPLRDLTKDRLDTLTGNEINIAATGPGRTPVMVSVVDTTPLADPVAPRSWHGIIVADLIQDISHGCTSASASCKTVVQNALGLPRFGFGKNDRDATRGGYAAFHSESARAVHDAVRAWEGMPSPKPKLILNLSIGWLRAFGGEVVDGDIADAPPAIKAFRLALERARCRGALVIVAAGNDNDDCETDAMLPADWEKLAAPDDDRCSDIGVNAEVLSVGTYSPLVHSVGGVDLDGNPISLTREGGRPRLAAYAAHVVGPDLTQPAMTGTSMSAAAVSGMAALVWSYRGGLLADAVMNQIYQSGTQVADAADYGLVTPTDPIKRVTACGALKRACGLFNCPAVPALTCVNGTMPTDALQTAVLALTADIDQNGNPLEANIVMEDIGECEQYCDDPAMQTYAGANVQGCTPLENEGDSRTMYLTWPQPDNLGCASCSWETANTGTTQQVTKIWTSLTKSYTGRDVTYASVNLVLEDGTSAGLPETHELGDIDVRSQFKTSQTLVDGPTLPIRSGTITLVIAASANAPAVVTTDVLVPGAATN